MAYQLLVLLFSLVTTRNIIFIINIYLIFLMIKNQVLQ